MLRIDKLEKIRFRDAQKRIRRLIVSGVVCSGCDSRELELDIEHRPS